MATLTLRNLCALSAFFVAVLLLSIHIQTSPTQPSQSAGKTHTKAGSVPSLSHHQTHEPSPLFQSSTHPHTHPKRNVSQTFQYLVCKGQQYWEQGVLPAFAGQSRFPTPNFGGAENPLADSGWSWTEDMKVVPNYWKDAFKTAKWKIPKEGMRQIYLDQNESFENDYGEQNATFGWYHGNYLPQSNLIIMYLTYSPRHRLEFRRTPLDAIPHRLPRMNQLSDVVWQVWASTTAETPKKLLKKKPTPGSLRYYAVEGISNDITKPLMMEIFQSRRGTTAVAYDKRITFDLSSEEGKALLGSPNGIAVAWMLIHHAKELGRREVRVTIWNSQRTNNMGDYLIMVWDLVPEGKKGTFGKVERGSGG